MKKTLIHLIESGASHVWFERLVENIHLAEVHQIVITVDKKGELKEKLSKFPVPVLSSNTLFKFFRLIQASRACRREGNRSDIVFVFAQGHLPCISAYFASFLYGIEYGVVHHQSPMVYFSELVLRKPIKGRAHRFLYKKYILRSKTIQALSIEVKNSLVQMGYPTQRIELIGHGINVRELQSKIRMYDTGASRENNSILMVGRLSWEKNYLFALDVIYELSKLYSELKVIIAGEGPDYRKIYESIEEKHLKGIVRLIGFTNDISFYMRNATLLLHLSMTESYGQVIVEAYFSNLPVFCYPVGVAQDLDQLGERMINLITSKSSKTVAKQLYDFLMTETAINPPSKNRLMAYDSVSHERAQRLTARYMVDFIRSLEEPVW